ncbi:MAG: universal stress protein [Deltaproteobacteria bacterium]|nr:universal stress protein [Deltaproteobacteria bacterium]
MPSTSAPILVAVDFSPDSEAAFGWALQAARLFGAPLVVVHVVHDPAAAPGYYAAAVDHVAEIEDVATDMMSKFVERMREEHSGIDGLSGFTSRVVVGLPVGRILEVAGQEGAQMIVMGGRGRSGLADVLLGSKVERVARLARIPVTIVRVGRPEQTADRAR